MANAPSSGTGCRELESDLPGDESENLPVGLFCRRRVEGCACDRPANPLSRTDANTNLAESFGYQPEPADHIDGQPQPDADGQDIFLQLDRQLLSKSDVRNSATMLP
jgi:hypothetical protein